jgi:hypothetical protein
MASAMIKTVKNFLSPDECATLNKIAKQGVEEGWVSVGVNGKDKAYTKRYTSRMHMDNAEYPQVVRDIATKVRQFAGVDEFPIITGHGKDGVVVSVTFKGGEVYSHKDPRSLMGMPTYRCNVLTQANEDGCDLYVGGEKVDLSVGDLHCYMVSEIEHYVTEAKGDTPRIMWMFGAHIPTERLGENL